MRGPTGMTMNHWGIALVKGGRAAAALLALSLLQSWMPEGGAAPEHDPDYLATYSIIARDPGTGELGMGVQSKAFAAGNRAMHAKGGVAVIAHQASANPMYGAIGIDLIERGYSPQEALDMMVASDEGRDRRQVAILDMQGRTAAWSGIGASDWKGHRCGRDYCAQGNILAGPEVVDAMAASIESSTGPLAERLMDALDAAEAAGGDARGKQSGAILVVAPRAGSGGFSDRVVDIRVDDHPRPLEELRRVLNLFRSGQMVRNVNASLAGGDLEGALATATAARDRSPENDNAWVALAAVQARMARPGDALESLRRAVELNPGRMRTLPRDQNFASLHEHPEFLRLVGGGDPGPAPDPEAAGAPGALRDPEAADPLGDEDVSTFSVIGFDPETQELGVGVQSRAFRAGAIVPYAVAGVGAVATQASANQSYGPRAIELLREGRTPEEVVRIITGEDPGRDVRQVAVIDTRGRVAAHTGADRVARPNQFAGHILGTSYSVQGNTLAGRQVITEMARAYEGTEGELAEKLMAALEAGEAAGGDTRGMQAAGIYVVKPIDGTRTTDKWVDIRVDDAVDPYRELRRLLNISLAPRQAERAEELMAEGHAEDAIAALERALAMYPHRDSYLFTLAEWYAEASRDRDALNSLRAAIRIRDIWRAEARASAAFNGLRDTEEFRLLISGER
ncbi:MAG: DUF1028 domain-containing protein [Gammaproteobacteria bacterium]|nr:DUF1028 domain-containing protein [Gammaproteobacteria bacterium]